MIVKDVNFEDLVNYKEPSMFIAFPHCTFKCDKENGCELCQNSKLVLEPDIVIDKTQLIEYYMKNSLTKAIVCGGLEPFDSELDLLPLIDTLRRQYKCNDPIIIYTGYTEEELDNGLFGHSQPAQQKVYWEAIKAYPNIIVKFGRFKPNQKPHFDPVLGVNLASDNQYAKEVGTDGTYA